MTIYTTRNPMSEARRQHIHGPLVRDEPRFRYELIAAPIALAALWVGLWS